jgi:sugar (pentulose or hexulose) kinase
MEVDDTPEDEHSLDLFWHALNYRTAATQHAEAMWQELEACVQRLIERAKDDVWDYRNEIS